MWPDRRAMDLFGIELPIVQAPMAGASSLEMALAVSGAGGLGSLAAATLDPDGLRGVLSAARAATAKPIAVNFFAHVEPDAAAATQEAWLRRLADYYRAHGVAPPDRLSAGPVVPFDAARCAVVEEFAPAVVSFHFGLPSPELIRRVKATGARVIASATTVDEALWLEDGGCDAVVAQGVEAGGHRGMFLTDDVPSQLGTVALVPQIADAVEVPVIAAGGIGDGRGIAAAFALGASAVQIGTAYLFTQEATVGALYADALQNAERLGTAVTNIFSGRPARCLVNRAVRELGPMAAEAAAFPFGFAAMAPLKADAEARGSRDFSAQYCGQAAPLGYPASSSQLTRDLADNALRRLKALSAASGD